MYIYTSTHKHNSQTITYNTRTHAQCTHTHHITTTLQIKTGYPTLISRGDRGGEEGLILGYRQ